MEKREEKMKIIKSLAIYKKYNNIIGYIVRKILSV